MHAIVEILGKVKLNTIKSNQSKYTILTYYGAKYLILTIEEDQSFNFLGGAEFFLFFFYFCCQNL